MATSRGPKTKYRQFQVRPSDTVDDRLGFLCPPVSRDIEDDLNVIRTLIRLITGEETWCTTPSATLKKLLSRVVVERPHESLVYLGDDVWKAPEIFLPESLSVFVNGVLLRASGINGYQIIENDKIQFKTIWTPPVSFTLRYAIGE